MTKRDLTKKELAFALSVSPRTINRWLKLEPPCPSEVDPTTDRRIFNRSETVLWRAANLDPDSENANLLPLGSKASLAKAELVRRLTVAKKNERDLANEKALKDLGLDVKILAAKSYEDYVAVDLEIGALLARGVLSPARARAIQAVIADARQNTKAHREESDEDEPQRLILLTEEGARLVRDFEGIISDPRREAILEHLAKEWAIDKEENPNTDLAALPEETEPKDTPPAPACPA